MGKKINLIQKVEEDKGILILPIGTLPLKTNKEVVEVIKQVKVQGVRLSYMREGTLVNIEYTVEKGTFNLKEINKDTDMSREMIPSIEIEEKELQKLLYKDRKYFNKKYCYSQGVVGG